MPVYLTPPSNGGVFWQASGPEKGHYYYLVEFPGVKQSDNVLQNSEKVTEPSEDSAIQ